MCRSMKSLKKFLVRAGILSLRTIHMNPHISETAYHFFNPDSNGWDLNQSKKPFQKDAVSERMIHRY